MPTIPEKAARRFVPEDFTERRGKVRDRVLLLPNSALIGQLSTDRLSVFDIILPVEIPKKGEVLTAMDAFWHLRLCGEFKFDLVAYGSGIDEYLPKSLQGMPELQRRMIIAKRMAMINREAIPRGYLTGTGWKAYQETAPEHMVCGHRLPPGLRDGDELPSPLFTATTKAEEGHDEHVDAATVDREIQDCSMRLYEAASTIARERGIIIADTKFEFGRDENGTLVCGDERLTPDSSRFWNAAAWQKSRQAEKKVEPPPAFDKEFARSWAKTKGIDKLDPTNPGDLAQAHALEIPTEVVWRTSRLYRYIFYLLSRRRLEWFQDAIMGVRTRYPRIEIVLGSESDAPQTEAGFKELKELNVPYAVHVISCHRNPDALRRYAEDIDPATAVVIAGAGKLAALSGVLQSWLVHYKKGHIPVIGVGFKGKTSTADFAAVLSQEELPEQPVVLNEDGRAYFGPDGFRHACIDATRKEFLASVVSSKEARLNLAVND